MINRKHITWLFLMGVISLFMGMTSIVNASDFCHDSLCIESASISDPIGRLNSNNDIFLSLNSEKVELYDFTVYCQIAECVNKELKILFEIDSFLDDEGLTFYIYKPSSEAESDVQNNTGVLTYSSSIPESLSLAELSEIISTGNKVTYRLAVDIDNTLEVGTTLNMKFNKNDGSFIQIPKNGDNITIIGFETHEFELNTTLLGLDPVVMTSQKEIEFVTLELKLALDATIKPNKKVDITFKSSEGNFIVTPNSRAGIDEIILYVESNSPGSNAVEEIARSTVFTSTDEHMVSFSAGSLNEASYPLFRDPSTSNIIIKFSMNDHPLTEEDEKITLQIAKISIPYTLDNFPAFQPNNKPIIHNFDEDAKISPSIGGIMVTNIKQYEDKKQPPTDFGPHTIAPILQFELKAIKTAVTINNIVIDNAVDSDAASIGFATNENSNENIINTSIYKNDLTTGLSFTNDELKGESALGFNSQQTSINMTTSPIFLPKNADETFFVTYEFGSISSFDSQKIAIARLGQIDFLIIYNGDEINSALNQNKPQAASPDAKVVLSEPNIMIKSIKDVSPTEVVQGQYQVPMLYVNLRTETPFSQVVFTIRNSSDFSAISNSVSKVWIYRDNSENDSRTPDQKFDPRHDQLLGSQIVLESKDTIDVGGIDISSEDSALFILYDIGQNAKENRVKAQLTDIRSENDTLVVGGELLRPEPSASASVTPNYVDSIELSHDITSLTDATKPHEITFKIKLRPSIPSINIDFLAPKFYLNTINSEKDIGPEFSLSPTHYESDNVTSDAEVTFIIQHTRAFSDGAACIDVFLQYNITPTQSVILNRFPIDRTPDTILYQGAAGQPTESCPKLPIHQTEQFYDQFMFPTYINEIHFLSNGDDNPKPFFTNMALKPSDTLTISFHENGQFIDAASIKLTLNSSLLTNISDYEYDPDSGELKIKTIGDSSGILLLNLNDIHNNPLPTATIKFTIQTDTILVTTPLFYPNPYDLTGPLTLGFNLNTVPGSNSTVTVYFFNAMGQLIHTKSETNLDTGYKTISFESSNSFLVPGVYLIKIVAQDDQGNQSIGTTKLGIY